MAVPPSSPEGSDPLKALSAEVVECRRCPRLVAWREAVAADPPKRFRGERYWARPVPGFGDPAARILIVGLAPAAHGANRTGRMFTGDRSGEWLYGAMHRAGLASRAKSIAPGDGLALSGAYISAVNRCAPPQNRPTTTERDACLPFLARELGLLPEVRVLVALGSFAWDGCLRALVALGAEPPRPKPRFGHGAEVPLPSLAGTRAAAELTLLGCFHPSQQNTFTGRLTEPMIDAVFARARDLARIAEPPPLRPTQA